MSNHAELVALSIRRRHVVAAAVSGVLSVLLHAGLLAWLVTGRLTLPFADPRRPIDADRDHTMRLQSVRPDPAPAVDRITIPPRAEAPSIGTQESVERLAWPIDTLDVEPPSLPGALGQERAPLADPPPLPAPEIWQPRQEILAVEETRIREDLALLPRRPIPDVERQPMAADIVYPATPEALPLLAPAPQIGTGGLAAPSLGELARMVTRGPTMRVDVGPGDFDPAPPGGSGVLAESPAEITDVRPLEALLSAGLATYTTRQDRDYGYFRLEIRRQSATVLPPLPKDLLFIQDASRSMGERLGFCRRGLLESLPLIGPDDRFNIVAFQDRVIPCFPGWMPNSEDARSRAAAFIESLETDGETDLYIALREALAFEQAPERPTIVVLITDGIATAGLTDGPAIIREFTAANTAGVSVFTIGTIRQANLYLLDLLSYSNRGDSRVAGQGRWALPELIRELARETSQPVLSDVRIQVAAGTPSEIYPVQSMNLYSDRPLVLYGRFPRQQSHVVVRATGHAGDTVSDMIFDLSLTQPALATGEDLRTEWARQSVWHLLGEHARTGDPALIPQMNTIARRYGVPIPHRPPSSP